MGNPLQTDDGQHLQCTAGGWQRQPALSQSELQSVWLIGDVPGVCVIVHQPAGTSLLEMHVCISSPSPAYMFQSVKRCAACTECAFSCFWH